MSDLEVIAENEKKTAKDRASWGLVFIGKRNEATAPGLHLVSSSRRTAATQDGPSASCWRSTAPSLARSSAPSSRPRGGRR